MSLVAVVLMALVAGAFATNGFASSSGSFGSSAKCSAQADATAIEEAQSAYVTAIANAFEVACSKDFTGSVWDVEAKFHDGWASAYAAAVTSAEAKCKTTGHAFACGTASAAAKAYAKATGKAHSEAVAAAINKCSCTSSEAITFGGSETYISLVASACSSVQAAVCVSGNQAAKASSYQYCLGIATARLFAKAVAKAVVAGGCVSSSAKAKIDASTGASFNIVKGCAASKVASGSPGSATYTHSGGKGKADVKNVRLSQPAALHRCSPAACAGRVLSSPAVVWLAASMLASDRLGPSCCLMQGA